MKRTVFASSLLVTMGIAIGMILISKFSPNSIDTVFAQENVKIGAANSPTNPDAAIQALNSSFINVSDAVKSSVVQISVESEVASRSEEIPDELREFFRYFGDPRGREDQEGRRRYGSGSGVIVTSDGYIVTNNHVIENAVDDGITIQLNDRKEYQAKIIGTDPLTDLAVLKVEASGLTPAHFGDPDNIRIGQIVLAVGSPLGLNSTVTQGIVSATGRGRLGLFNGENRSYSVEHFIQTDAAINPGNSGGGLFDINGSLVGINTAIASRTGGFIGYGFAIPVNIAQSVIEDLIEDGVVNRGYIGVQIRSVDDLIMAKSLGLDEVAGVIVDKVMPESAGEEAGLEAGDVIIEIDGEKLYTSNQLQSEIVLRRAGDKVDLTIWRNEEKINKIIKLKPRDDEEEIASIEEEIMEVEPFNFEDLGFEVEPLTKEIKERLDVPSGVVVSSIERYGHAAKRGLYTGGVIIKADRKEVNSVKDLKRIFAEKNGGDAVLLQVVYENTTQMVALEIPSDEG